MTGEALLLTQQADKALGLLDWSVRHLEPNREQGYALRTLEARSDNLANVDGRGL